METGSLHTEDILMHTGDIPRKAEDVLRRAEAILRPRKTASVWCEEATGWRIAVSASRDTDFG